ncbi:MAG: hypothetical protein PHG66_06430 [Candidatus Colwellbacteria bacterium]|nr:hypothetical protein [Candidatus Colwellbacteria bacterium]
METLLPNSFETIDVSSVSTEETPLIGTPPLMYTDNPEPPLKIELSPPVTEISKECTIIIFDWDDTIMCSTFMEQDNITLHSESIMVHKHWEELDKLSKSAIDIITISKTFGEVVIITNAEEGWVQLSAQKFMPELIPILKTIRIFSARTSYQNAYPENPYMWKYMTMKSLLDSKVYNEDDKKNIISFGDSLVERSSLMNVTKKMKNTLPKSVKFSERSSIDSLRRQLDLLKNSMKYVTEFNGPLDLHLKVNIESMKNDIH